ncbi:MAG TPA: lytic transglycosylase domain-containing protein [Candidatus Acidoferrales bacterium]|nr:lytic transglycosylase domain-containing protein [Candidatus Acidoferrales bacterium]
MAARLLIILSLAIGFFAVAPRFALAAEVKIPLTIDYLSLREALKRQLYTAPGGRAPLWNGIDECQYLYAENPAFAHAGATQVRLETATSLGLGVALGGRCVSAVEWSGIVDAVGTPYIAPGLKLKFNFTDLNLYDTNHQKTSLASRGFDLIKQYLIPRLDAFAYDLNPAVAQLATLAQDAAPAEAAERIRKAIESLNAERDIAALDDGIRITLVMTVPDFPAATRGAPATPVALTPAEMKAFTTTLDQWDAFLVFAIKQLGATDADSQFRDDLMRILLDSRQRLVQALQNPAENAQPDPVRVIFLDEWRELHDAVKSAAARGKLGARALEFVSFISAGDALFALDQAAPALGMRISANDLRRLARIMAPQATGDPLQFNYDEDQDLKNLFAVREPPGASRPMTTAAPAAPPSPAATPTPTSPVSMRQQTPWFIGRFLELFSPQPAFADAYGSCDVLREAAIGFGKRAVDESDAADYRARMAQMLELAAQCQVALDSIDARYQPMFPVLVSSTAWQESCWRQFIVAAGQLTWLESSTGDIGLMQVNKHVWRGFYDIERLEWDVMYNAGAGAEILSRLMKYASARPAGEPQLTLDQVARSTYAAYNGGPSSRNRWRRHEVPALRQIDDSFWDKFRAVKSGVTIDILSCARNWGRGPRH